MTQSQSNVSQSESGGFGFWYSVGSGPVLWAAHLAIAYALASLACQLGFLIDSTILGMNALTFLLLVITLVFLAGVVYGGWLAYRAWKNLREDPRGIGVPEGSRTRFLMFSGLLLNILFAGALILSIVPIFYFRPCS